MASAEPTDAQRREAALGEYRKKLVKHKEVDTKVRSLREDAELAAAAAAIDAVSAS